MIYRMADTGAVVTWETGAAPSDPFYKVERMAAMAFGEVAPPVLYFATEDTAIVVAIAWAASEPWRRHSQLAYFAPGHTTGLDYYERECPRGPVVCRTVNAPEPR